LKISCRKFNLHLCYSKPVLLVIELNNNLFQQETSMAHQKLACSLATTFLLCTSSVHAQSSTTLFGLVDLGLESANAGAGNVTRVQSGQWFGSRLGVRGSEDLGGGL
jgi:hypothetical protein